MNEVRKESDSLGEVDVPADKLWGAQTQRSLEHFSIGKDLIPREMITSYATLKKAAANANHAAGKRLNDQAHKLIVQVCDEILAGEHDDMFPLHVWMTGSGTQFNMNVNEVISNRCCQIAGTPLGSKAPVHPNDHVNMAQSSNDTFPSAMYIATAVNAKQRLLPPGRDARAPIEANTKKRGGENKKKEKPKFLPLNQKKVKPVPTPLAQNKIHQRSVQKADSEKQHKKAIRSFALQVGTFGENKNAIKLRDKMRKAGYTAFVIKSSANGKTSYKVRVGPELKRSVLEKTKEKIKKTMKIDGYIVNHP